MFKMNKIILFFLLLIHVDSFASKEELKKIFDNGNIAYQKADYTTAIDNYKSIINKGYSNSQVYFNLGNSYFKLKDFPNSILYYEKAYKLNSSDGDIRHNLKLANKNITDKIEPIPDFFMKRLWLDLVFSQKIDSWAILSLVALFLALLLFILFFLSGNPSLKKTGFYSAFLFLFLSLLTYALAWQQENFLNENNNAIIFESSLTVKSAPDEKSTALFVIHEGTKVIITETLGEWNKVKLENGNMGWIKSKTFQII